MKKATTNNKKKVMNMMQKELMEILRTTDYSTYELTIYFDEANRTVIIPKPVMALSMVNEAVRNWSAEEVLKHPGYNIIVA